MEPLADSAEALKLYFDKRISLERLHPAQVRTGETWWCIKYRGRLKMDLIRRTRRGLMQAFCGSRGESAFVMEKRGYRAVKITVQEQPHAE